MISLNEELTVKRFFNQKIYIYILIQTSRSIISNQAITNRHIYTRNDFTTDTHLLEETPANKLDFYPG